MSEHITHVAVYEDCTRIIKSKPEKFPKAFIEGLKNHYDYGLIACGTRGTRDYAVPLLKKYKDKKLDDNAIQMITGALGWICHRAADGQLNYLADEMDKDESPYYTGQDLKLYYDAIVVHQIYKSGKVSSESENELISEATLASKMHTNPATKAFNMDLMEILVTNHHMREYLEMHQFNRTTPEKGKLEEFINLHDSRSQYYGENLPLYIDAFENPDPVMMQAVNYRINFYNPEDELIRYARGIQDGKPTNINLEDALQKAETQSHYAKALKLNYDYWFCSGLYFEGKIDAQQLEKQLYKRFS